LGCHHAGAEAAGDGLAHAEEQYGEKGFVPHVGTSYVQAVTFSVVSPATCNEQDKWYEGLKANPSQ